MKTENSRFRVVLRLGRDVDQVRGGGGVNKGPKRHRPYRDRKNVAAYARESIHIYLLTSLPQFRRRRPVRWGERHHPVEPRVACTVQLSFADSPDTNSPSHFQLRPAAVSVLSSGEESLSGFAPISLNFCGYSAVVGSITDLTSETRFAGKPPCSACSRTVFSSGAM